MSEMRVSQTANLNKSTLFHFYNRSRAAAVGLDRGRCNRALGLVLAGKIRLLNDGNAVATGSRGETYYVNADGCTCKDVKYNGVAWCKHRTARGYLVRMRQQEESAARRDETTPASYEQDIALLYGKKVAA